MNIMPYITLVISSLVLGFYIGRKYQGYISSKKGLSKIVNTSLEFFILVLVFLIGLETGNSWTTSNSSMVIYSAMLGILSGLLSGILLNIFRESDSK